MKIRLSFAVLAAGAFALAACTATSPATPTAEPPPVTTPVPVTAQPMTPQPATPTAATPPPGATATPAASPTLPAADPELEATLPDTVGGLPLVKLSLRGEQFLPRAGEDFVNFVDELGVDPANITIATATGGTADRSQNLVVFALRLPGATAEQLLGTYSTAVSTNNPDVTITPAHLGGKDVFGMTGGQLVQPTYFYAIDDVFFVVTASDQALAEEAIGRLP